MPRHRTTLASLALLLAAGGCKPPEVSITETPIKVVSHNEGYGEPIGAGDVVIVDYVVKLPDGRELLNQTGFRFKVGSDSVIRGIDEAILGMRTGGVRAFTCPPHKHWGRAGYGNGLIPPATDLSITLKVVSIEGRERRRVVSGAAGRDDR